MSVHVSFDRWLARQPGWVQGAVIGGLGWGIYGAAFKLSEVGGWRRPAVALGQVGLSFAFGLVTGGTVGAVYEGVRRAILARASGRDRPWVDVLAGTLGLLAVALPIAFLTRELIGAAWPALAAGAALIGGGFCLGPIVRGIRRHYARSQHHVA